MSCQIWAIIGLLVASTVTPYSYMVPQDSCYTMMPVHNNSRPQSSLAPFEILIYKNSYLPLERVKITLSGIMGAQFKGFMIQARPVRGTGIIGSWAFNSPGDEVVDNEFIGVLKCTQFNNTLVHAWPEFYQQNIKVFNNVTAFWLAPNYSNVDVEATVVQRYDVYWTNVKSRVLAPNKFLGNGAASRNKNKLASFVMILFTLIYIFIRHL